MAAICQHLAAGGLTIRSLKSCNFVLSLNSTTQANTNSRQRHCCKVAARSQERYLNYSSFVGGLSRLELSDWIHSPRGVESHRTWNATDGKCYRWPTFSELMNWTASLVCRDGLHLEILIAIITRYFKYRSICLL